MRKITNFIKAVLMIVIITVTNLMYAQNVSYLTPKTYNIDIGETVTLTNNSSNMPTGTNYKWVFENCSFVIDSTLYCDYTQGPQNDSITGFFVSSGSHNISLTAYDQSNNIIGSFNQTYVLNPPTSCGTTCHDSLTFSCNDSNLICNPSFEFISSTITNQGLLYLAEPWCQLGSADQFMPNMTPIYVPPVSVSIPSNAMGYQTPRTDSMYAGLVSFVYNTGVNEPYNIVEYMTTPVKTAVVNGTAHNTLFAGQRYGLSFYFSRGDNTKFATDGLQAYLSSNMLANGPSLTQYTIVKQSTDPDFLHPFDSTIITDDTAWVQFYSEYIPNASNIKYLTIGYFHYLTAADANTHYKYVQNSGMKNAYYYVDDVSLVPLAPIVSVNSPQSNCDSVELVVTGIGAGHYLWNTGDTTSSIFVAPQSTTTYTVTVTDFYDCNPVVLNSVVSVNPMIVPIINGYQNNCDSTVTYSIENFDTNYTYTWSTQIFDTSNTYSTGQFIINGSTNVETANIANIDWYSATFPTVPNYVVITVEAHLNGSNCSAISTLKVYECCEGDMGTGGFYWHDTTITSSHIIKNFNLAINGTVYLQDSLMLSNGVGIWMGPYAKIVLESGAIFEIDKGSIRNGCDFMWDGVYASSTNETIHLNNAGVEGAINGIVSKNGANIFLDSVYFIDNLIGAQVLEHKTASFPLPPPTYTPINAYITNCIFKTATTNPLALIWPYNGQQPITGINISNIEGIDIGDTINNGDTIYNDGNTFRNMRHAIMIYNSKVNIYNNHFVNIENQMNPSNGIDKGAIVIKSKGMFNMENIGDVQIIGLGNYPNVFDSCYQSITSSNSKLRVENNIFSGGHLGVDVYNFKNGTKIQNNRFKDMLYGIHINNLIGGNRKLDIDNNYFEGLADNSFTTIGKEAINVINCNSQANSSIRTKIANNTIRYSGPKNTLTSGIRVQNCNGIMVNSNHIARTQISVSTINADWDKTIGIRVAACQGATITDNYIWGFGQSITTYGNLNGTQFSCNELKFYKFGFYWGANTALSDQGVYNLRNTHNEWATLGSIIGNEKLNTTMAANLINVTAIDWYYFSALGSQWIPNDVYFGVPKILTISNDTATHLCVGGSGGGGNGGSGTGTGGGSSTGGGSAVLSLLDNIEDPEIRDFLFEDILNGEQYIDLQNEYRAYDANWLYDMLLEDTSMMWLGGSLDADYRQFFDSIRMSNIGDFTKVYDLIEAGNFEEAKALNNAIVPEQNIFVNLQTVLNIYLDSWCIERYDLSGLEYETLFTIANQTPYEGGDAVYTARIMIGFEPDEYGVAYRINTHKEVEDEREELFLYPNPASDKVTIEFSNDTFENVNAKLFVYTITGRLIYETQFYTNNSFKVLSVDMLKNGVYIYRISLSNGIDKSGKLVILKQ